MWDKNAMANRRQLLPKASVMAHEIHHRMQALGMSQKALALAAGLNETYVRDLFSGKSQNPRLEHLSKLARALGCSVEELAHPIPGGTDPALVEFVKAPGLLPLRPAEVGLVRLFRGMGQSERDQLIDRASELVAPPDVPRKIGGA